MYDYENIYDWIWNMLVKSSTIAQGQVWHFVPNNNYCWNISFYHMPYYTNTGIHQD